MTVSSSAAVVVAYHPDEGLRDRLIKMASSVGKLIVVDNTPDRSEVAFHALDGIGNAILISNEYNLGIASALNRGIRAAVALGADRIFLFDQDSEPEENIFSGLHTELDHLQAQGLRIALVGPSYFDTRLKKTAPFIRFSGMRMLRVRAPELRSVAADYLITSGSCIDAAAWKEIGEMDDTLFIDYVDIEWGLRAKALGFKIYGIPGLVMQHCLGDEPVSVFGFKFPLHSPLRHYYFFRNVLLLMRREYIPLNWKIIEFCKIPLRFVVYALFTKNRWGHTRMMLRGLLDGLLGRSGRFDA